MEEKEKMSRDNHKLRNKILDNLFRSEWMESLLTKITSNHSLKEDLRQELFLILCENKDEKIIEMSENNYLTYHCVVILKRQYHSNTSPFHKKWRKGMGSRELPEIVDKNEKGVDWDIVGHIENIVDTKLDMVDRELFKLYYKWDNYDPYFGLLKDTNCDNHMSSYRKMSRKLSIGDTTISRSTISLSIQRSVMIIKKELNAIGITN